MCRVSPNIQISGKVERDRKVGREARAARVVEVAIDGATRAGNPTVRVGRHGTTSKILQTFHGKGRAMELSAPLRCQTRGWWKPVEIVMGKWV
jgi:hypothetical protein